MEHNFLKEIVTQEILTLFCCFSLFGPQKLISTKEDMKEKKNAFSTLVEEPLS
jgi:hypothetical protein